MKKPWYSPQSRAFNELLRALKNAFAMVGIVFVVAVIVGNVKKPDELLYLLAAIGLIAACAMVVVIFWVFLQILTDDNMKPRKPWWWRF